MSFTPASGFFSYVTPLTYIQNGQTGEACMIGEDGNHYVATVQLFVETERLRVMCMETGDTVGRTLTQYQTDVATRQPSIIADDYAPDLIIPCPGTKYFWTLGTFSSDSIVCILYKIVDPTTITAVGSIYALEGDAAGLPGLVFGSTVVGNSVKSVAHVRSDSFFLGVTQPAFITLPLTETDTQESDGGWRADHITLITCLGSNFFGYELGLDTLTLATVVSVGSQLGVLIYVSAGIYQFMAAHPGDNTVWDTITGPCVLWVQNNTLTDVTGLFGIDDIETHLDGTASTNINDDYTSPSTFTIDGAQYLSFSRSYTQGTDLLPTGTLVRTRIYLWTIDEAILVFDHTMSLFDTVVDTGASSGGRTSSYPDFIQMGFDPTTRYLYYSWYGHSSGGQPLTAYYVFGTAYHSTPSSGYKVVISELRNPDYEDWYTVGGADFDSYLYTSFYLSSENALFMQAPWVISYLDNTTDYVIDGDDVQVTQENDDNVWVMPSLLLTPQWEWTDSQSNHKSGPTLDVYLLRPKSTVSDRRTRVRGKGRALQLHWQSSNHKPFNILGWSVLVDENSSY